MTFLTIVMRSLIRRPVRTGVVLAAFCTMFGGIFVPVGKAEDNKDAKDKSIYEQPLFQVRFDLAVFKAGKYAIPPPFPASVEERISKVPGVLAVTSSLSRMMSVEEVAIITVSGRRWGGFGWEHLTVFKGRMPKDASEPVVVLGRFAAEMLRKNVGDKVFLDSTELEVVGIVDGHSIAENSTVIMALPVFQQDQGEPDVINTVHVRLVKGATKQQTDEVIANIKQTFPEAIVNSATELASRAVPGNGEKTTHAEANSTPLKK